MANPYCLVYWLIAINIAILWNRLVSDPLFYDATLGIKARRPTAIAFTVEPVYNMILFVSDLLAKDTLSWRWSMQCTLGVQIRIYI